MERGSHYLQNFNPTQMALTVAAVEFIEQVLCLFTFERAPFRLGNGAIPTSPGLIRKVFRQPMGLIPSLPIRLPTLNDGIRYGIRQAECDKVRGPLLPPMRKMPPVNLNGPRRNERLEKNRGLHISPSFHRSPQIGDLRVPCRILRGSRLRSGPLLFPASHGSPRIGDLRGSRLRSGPLSFPPSHVDTDRIGCQFA